MDLSGFLCGVTHHGHNKRNGADEKNFAGERQKTSDDQPNDSEAPTTTSSTSTAVIPTSTRTMDTMKDSLEAASKQKLVTYTTM